MTVRHVPVGEVLQLRRSLVDIDAFHNYTLIGIYSFGKGIFHRPPIAGVDLGSYRYFQIRPGDLVLSNIQAWEGAIAYATAADLDTVATHRFLTYVPRNGRIDTNWARYFFLSQPGFQLIQQAAPGTVKRNRTLSIQRFEELVIPLPPMTRQIQTANELDRVGRQLDRLNMLDTTISHTASVLVPSLLASSARRVAIGSLLRQVRREELVDPSRDYRLLGARWYGEGLFVREAKPGTEIAAKKLYRVQEGDFVYNRLFAWKGSFAVAGPEVDDCYVSGEFPTFEVDPASVDIRYLHALFTDPAMWELVEDRSTGGTPTSRNRLKEAEFLNLTIPVPPLREQVRAAHIVEMVHSTRELRRHRRQYSDGLRASALNRAFAGLTQ